jgi:nitrate/nitrite transporter NarK
VGFLVGIACAIALADRWGRIPLQIIGFVGCAAGLVIAALGNLGGHNNLVVIVIGFVLFQFMTNLGPNAQTYLLAGEVFPTPVRGLGAGLAAAVGKVGAVLTAFAFPVLLATWGTERLLPLLAITSLVGAVITWIYRIETTGVDMGSI